MLDNVAMFIGPLAPQFGSVHQLIQLTRTHEATPVRCIRGGPMSVSSDCARAIGFRFGRSSHECVSPAFSWGKEVPGTRRQWTSPAQPLGGDEQIGCRRL